MRPASVPGTFGRSYPTRLNAAVWLLTLDFDGDDRLLGMEVGGGRNQLITAAMRGDAVPARLTLRRASDLAYLWFTPSKAAITYSLLLDDERLPHPLRLEFDDRWRLLALGVPDASKQLHPGLLAGALVFDPAPAGGAEQPSA
ncbi:MAG: hypothetical protein FJ318_10185 [SAR202 cluster bacterium]|nr:hypothetical protein [SAR202 cluster bacterium]